jgi:phosphate transport system protein
VSTHHTVKSFDEELEHLRGTIKEMGDLVLQQLYALITGFGDSQLAFAEQVEALDLRLNGLDRKVYEMAIRLIALRQPMASDLRMVVASLRISANLERIGDYAKNAAHHLQTLQTLAPTGLEERVAHIGLAARKLIEDALSAYVKNDGALAEAVRQADQSVDEQYTQLFKASLDLMVDDVGQVSGGTHLLFIARAFERIGDHGTNVAEDVLFLEQGHIPEDDRIKADQSTSIVVS